MCILNDAYSYLMDSRAHRIAVLRFDGGSRGNPGIAGCGFVLTMNPNTAEEEKAMGAFYLGDSRTNNYAEYVGLIEGLKRAETCGVTDIHVEGDSMLVIKQVSGEWNVNSPNLRRLHELATELASQFVIRSFTHIPRRENQDADELANLAMDLPHIYPWDGITDS